MKRYEIYGTVDGGAETERVEDEYGDWVRYEDAVVAVAAERERCARMAECYDLGTSEGHAIAAGIRDAAMQPDPEGKK